MSTNSSVAFDPKAFAKRLTNAPGVYRMLAEDGTPLYVGKAANLRKRVSSYFARPAAELRIASMLKQVASIDVSITRTDTEALILEAELIKSLKPRYNVLLRDDKSFPYIFISDQDAFPRIAIHRGAKAAKGKYFGPFPGAHSVRESLNLMQKLFRVRQCEDSFFRSRSRPCLQYQIGRCTAPCVGLISEQDYARDVQYVSQFLQGRSQNVIADLVQAMDQHSRKLEFEAAARLRDQIAHLKSLQAKQFVTGIDGDVDVFACAMAQSNACVHGMFFRDGRNLGGYNYFPRIPQGAQAQEVLAAFLAQFYLQRQPPALLLCAQMPEDKQLLEQAFTEQRGSAVELRQAQRGDLVKLVSSAQLNADNALATELAGKESQARRWHEMQLLLGVPDAIGRVECFDISHTQGEATVASCVVFDEQGPIKTQYRRYNIIGITEGDDYAAMHAAVARRFKPDVEGQLVLPDVLLIDGGKGQISVVQKALQELGVKIPVIVGVAKGLGRRPGLEELILANDNRIVRPASNHPGLHAIQYIRDEAHRFALSGHRNRREKKRTQSMLQDISGIGAKRRAALLKHFGGLQGVKSAGVEELIAIPGINQELAQRIYDTLH